MGTGDSFTYEPTCRHICVLGNANSEQRENLNDFSRIFFFVYPSVPSSPTYTMREGVLYFQYVCGHDDLIKHKKGHCYQNKVYI